MLPEHIDPDDVDLDDEAIVEAFGDPRYAGDFPGLPHPDMMDALRRVAKAASTRTALYLGMYYGQETNGRYDDSPLRHEVGTLLAASLGQYYRNEFDADGFRKVLDLHLLSNLITDMIAEKFGVDPEAMPNG